MATDFSNAPAEVQQEVRDCYLAINEWYARATRALEAREFKRAKDAFDSALIVNNRLEYLNDKWHRLNVVVDMDLQAVARLAWKTDPRTRDLLSERPHRKALVNFAIKRNAIPRSQAPAVKLVARAALEAGRSEEYLATCVLFGAFDVDSNTVLIAEDLADEDEVATILHEHVHAYERLKCWVPDEQFVKLQERQLLAEWKACNQQELEEW